MPEPSGDAGQQAAQAAAASANTQAASSQDDGEPFDKDRALKTIQAQRDEVKALKAQAREVETLKTKLKAFEDAQLSDSEKRDKALSDAQAAIAERDARLRDLTIRHEFTARAAADGARRPDAIVRLYADDVEVDTSGQPKNLDALLKKARAEYPELFTARNGSADGGSGVAAGGAGRTMNDMIRAAAGRGT